MSKIDLDAIVVFGGDGTIPLLTARIRDYELRSNAKRFGLLPK
ncbi:MAG: hypothetical protein ACE5KT_00610 [Methanosarcinales archaeon]